MQGKTNTPPPSPANRKPLRQAVQDVRSGNVPVPSPQANAQNNAPQQPQPENNAAMPKLRNAGNIIPESMKRSIQQTQQNNAPVPPQQNIAPPPVAAPMPPDQNQIQKEYFEAPTYYEGGDESSGFIEFDLQSYRQRGVEDRFLAISVVGLLDQVNIDDQEVAAQVVNNVSRTSMRITDKNQFYALKDFFANLEWEG